MAVVEYLDGGSRHISTEQGLLVWQILNGKVEPDEKQAKFVARVKKINLNWRTAPDDYLLMHKEVLSETALIHFVCTFEGVPTRPEPDDSDLWRISKVLGLLDKHGNATDYMNELIRKYYFKEFMSKKPENKPTVPYKD